MIKELLVDREKFINWFLSDELDKLINIQDMNDDLIKSGEFILTADDLLSRAIYVPGHVLVELPEGSKITDEFSPAHARLIYKQKENEN